MFSARNAALCAIVVVLCGLGPAAAPAQLVISQVYGGGNNQGSLYTTDYIELFNNDVAPIDFSATPHAVHYRAATGTSFTRVSLTAGTVQPFGYFLIRTQAIPATPPFLNVNLPTPDLVATAPDMSATAGVVALTFGDVLLTSPASPPFCPPIVGGGGTLLDLVGYGTTATCSEPTATPATANNAPAHSNQHAVFRDSCGGIDTGNNGANWFVGLPNPRNSSCGSFDPFGSPVSAWGGASPTVVRAGDPTLLTVIPRACSGGYITGALVTVNLTAIGGSSSTAFNDNGLSGDERAGDGIYSFLATVDAGTAVGAHSLPVTVTQPAGSPVQVTFITLTATSNLGPANDSARTALLIPPIGPSGTPNSYAPPGNGISGTLSGAREESNPVSNGFDTDSGHNASGAAREGLWYTVIGTGTTMTAALCGTAPTFDNVIGVYCGSPDGLTVAEGADDECGSLQARADWCSVAGATYYLWISTFSANAPTQTFALLITDNGVSCATARPCDVCVPTIPGGASFELETNAGPATNDGCDASSVAGATAVMFTDVTPSASPQSYVGTTRAYGAGATTAGTADFDWYRFQAPANDTLDVSLTAQLPIAIELRQLSLTGTCSTNALLASDTAERCETANFTTAIAAGNWYAVRVRPNLPAANNNNSGFAAGALSNQYVLTLQTGVPTAPSCAASASPTLVTADGAGMTTFTVVVTPGTNPASTAHAVSADLTPLGGAPAEPLIEGPPNTFTLMYTIPAGVSGGPKTVTFTVLETAPLARTSSCSTGLNVIPPNDQCINAIPLPCGTPVLGTIQFATVDSPPAPSTCPDTGEGGVNTVNNARNGVWFSFTGTGGPMRFSNCAAGSNFDSQISIFSGTCGALVCVAANDDANSNTPPNTLCGLSTVRSIVNFNSSPGQPYLALITPFSAAPTTFAFEVTLTATVPFANPGSNSPVCEGDLIQLEAPANADSYSWTGPNGFVSDQQSPSIPNATLADAGAYSLTVVFDCFSDSGVTDVTVNPRPIATAANDGPVCELLALQLTGGPDGMTSYTWSGPNGFASSAQNPTLASPTVADAGVYTLTVTNSNGCVDDESTTVVIHATPLATAANNGPHCAGATLNLLGGPDGMTSYSWSGPDGFVSGDQNPSIPNVTAAATGLYTLTVTDSNGCSDDESTAVVIHAAPLATAANDGPHCAGATLNLVGGPDGMTSYSWSGPDGFASSDQNPSIPNVTAAAAGLYTLTVTDSNGCSDDESTTVIINANPIATAANNGPLCAGATLNLLGGPDGMTSYSWSGPDGFASSDQNPSIPNVTAAAAGLYTLTVTDSNGCIDDESTTVVVNASPIATAANNGPLCEGETLNLLGGPDGMTSYTWSGPNGFASSDQNPSIPNVTAAAAGLYTLTVTDSNGCSDDESTSVTVSANPVATAASNSPVCEGGTLNLLGGPDGMTSYTWSGPNGFASSDQNPSISNVTAATAGEYSLTVAIGDCSDSATTNVSVIPGPTATAASNSPVCEGSTLNLLGGPDGMTSYTWSGPNGFASSDQNPSIPNVTAAAAGLYTLTVADSSGCNDTESTMVTIGTGPLATAASNSPLCEGATLNLLGGPDGMTSYTWSGPNGFASSDQNPSIPNVTAAAAGLYTLTVTDSNGCSDDESTSVTVSANPVATAASNSPVCEGSTLNLLGGPDGMTSYTWSGPNGFASSDQNPSIPNVTAAAAGEYSLTVAIGDCSDSATTTVSVVPGPAATAASNSPVTVGAILHLSGGPDGADSYSWTGPDAFASSDQNPSIVNVTAAAAGTYSLTVVDEGCSATAMTDVVIGPCPGARGDTNCDGVIDFFDIDPFLSALFDLDTPLTGYRATHCGGSICTADIDCSNGVDFFDVDPFLACLFAACPACAP